MKYRDCIVAWTPSYGPYDHLETVGEIAVGPHPDTTGWSGRYARVHASGLFISNDMGGSEVSSFALTVFAGIAEFERGLIHQRTRNFLQA